LHFVTNLATYQDVMSTGNRIEARREALDLTRVQLAERLLSLGMKHAATKKTSMRATYLKVWRIETGRTRIHLEELPLYAKALKTTVEELVA
jgi:transcriptional regulator with XRE-family HTH domain